jgi:hypothetical protein
MAAFVLNPFAISAECGWGRGGETFCRSGPYLGMPAGEQAGGQHEADDPFRVSLMLIYR